jgi:hypothetical protein
LRIEDIHFEHVWQGFSSQFVSPDTLAALYLRRGIIKCSRNDTVDIVKIECRNYIKCRKVNTVTLYARTTLCALAHAFKIMNNEY